MKTFEKLFRLYFLQFRKMDAICNVLLGLVIRILDPHLVPSYSQTGEDRIIESIISIYSQRRGADFTSKLYVDVGCNEPEKGSNTFGLYKKGWSGLCIDANQFLIDKFQRARPQDIAICSAVSNLHEEVIFYQFEKSAYSSLNHEHAKKVSQGISSLESSRTIKPESLSSILNRHKIPGKFGLLSIDVESHDFEVLLSLDLNFHRPTLIVIEMLGFDVSRYEDNEIIDYLQSHGYRMIAFALLNGYFLDERPDD